MDINSIQMFLSTIVVVVSHKSTLLSRYHQNISMIVRLYGIKSDAVFLSIDVNLYTQGGGFVNYNVVHCGFTSERPYDFVYFCVNISLCDFL